MISGVKSLSDDTMQNASIFFVYRVSMASMGHRHIGGNFTFGQVELLDRLDGVLMQLFLPSFHGMTLPVAVGSTNAHNAVFRHFGENFFNFSGGSIIRINKERRFSGLTLPLAFLATYLFFLLAEQCPLIQRNLQKRAFLWGYLVSKFLVHLRLRLANAPIKLSISQ